MGARLQDADPSANGALTLVVVHPDAFTSSVWHREVNPWFSAHCVWRRTGFTSGCQAHGVNHTETKRLYERERERAKQLAVER